VLLFALINNVPYFWSGAGEVVAEIDEIAVL